MWPAENLIQDRKITEELDANIIPGLALKAEKMSPGGTALIALDWLNGRRTPYADQKLKGAIAGLSLGTTAPAIFRAIVEATAFGSRAIIERFKEEGVEIKEVIAIGGIAQKSPFVMQVLADVLHMPVKVAASSQAVALGAAVFAAAASGYYSSVEKAQEKMASSIQTTYIPVRENTSAYDKSYRLYSELGDSLEGILRKL